MNSTYEVEIKCLLGGKDKADALVGQLESKNPGLKPESFHKQLNHYFIGGNLQELYKNVQEFLPQDKKEAIQTLLKDAKNFSLRTRQADDKVILVIKVSVDEGTSANTVGRLEFGAEIPNLTLEELDALVLKSGFQYQAKWSRERTEYKLEDTSVTIDKNAGYGYLAEFEKVVDDETKVPEAKISLKKLMEELGVEELPQDRLERMFAYYNANWREYYGTDKVFVVE
ncbi:MAG: CYTH domain-containing protein [Candidatus Colwellbacteria bacterium]|nr:CYTH domain-containing protein [Candidatus Colwellbacteria bacterium]